MPRVNIPVTAATARGVQLPDATVGDATNNHVLANSGREKLLVSNTGAGARSVTIKFNKTVQGQTVTDLVQAIPAGKTWFFGPFPVEDFGTSMQVNTEHAELTFRAIV